MARNPIISAGTAQDIDSRVERVLRGLGHPEPPLRLEDVRELLELDRVFYTADDPGVVRETISRIRIGGIQVFKVAGETEQISMQDGLVTTWIEVNPLALTVSMEHREDSTLKLENNINKIGKLCLN